MGGTMKINDISCGTWPLIEHGINEYVRQHGQKPAALLL
jgi:hypothetical protein